MNYYQIENYFKKHNVQSVKLLLIANILIFLLSSDFSASSNQGD